MEEKLLEKVVLLDQPCNLGREGYGAVRKEGHPPSQTDQLNQPQRPMR